MYGQGVDQGRRKAPALAGRELGSGLVKAVLRTKGAHGTINPFTEEQLSDDELQVIMDWFEDVNASPKGFMVGESKLVTLLAYEKNGNPMTGEGLIQLAMGMDKYTSRFAHWVRTIEVK